MPLPAPTSNHRARVVPIVALALWLGCVAGTVVAVDRTQASAHRAVRERFDLRVTVASQFVEAWVADLFRRQNAVASSVLGDTTVAEQDFRRSALAFEYPAAVLLDADGRVIHALPSNPGLVGIDLTNKYAHLRTAVSGRPAISSVVPSAVEHRPIVAFAVPFDTASGRRVFSGGFDVSHSPLAAFLTNAVQVRPNRAYLIDQSSGVVASNMRTPEDTGFAPFSQADRPLAAALKHAPTGNVKRSNDTEYFTSARVAGTPWTIVLSQSARVIYAPIGVQRSILWLLAAGISIAGLLIALLVIRLAKLGAARKAALVELRANEIDLAAARDLAVQASTHKTAFLATMSHEIRTPMAAVIGLSELLGETALDPDQREMATMIGASSRSLLSLVDDLLDVSKAEAGKLTIEARDFVLRDVVEGVRELLAVSASAKGLELIVSLDPAVPVRVYGDPNRIRQVLLNLMGNAIKFTATGSVRLSVSADELSPSSMVARFEVQDTGIGIAPDKQAMIFEPFSQAERSTTRDFGGTGLGLTITRELVDLMGGSCGVASEPVQGATFWFTTRFGVISTADGPQTTVPSSVHA